MSAVVSTAPAPPRPPGSEHPLPAALGWGTPHAPLAPPPALSPRQGAWVAHSLFPSRCISSGAAMEALPFLIAPPHPRRPAVGQGVGGLAGETPHPLLAPRRAPSASSQRRSRPCAPSWSTSPLRTMAPSSGGVRRSPHTPCRR